jgi:hypothetical protein
MEWIHEGQWDHRIFFKDGNLVRPIRVILDSQHHVDKDNVEACVFYETKSKDGIIHLHWAPWNEISRVTSKKL